MNETKLIVYIHIPKTAGTTLREIIKQQYPEGVASLEVMDPAAFPAQLPPFVDQITSPGSKIKWVNGHLSMEVKDYLPKSTKYVTMLRKPTEQVISHYHYIRRQPGHPLHKLVHPMTLSEFIEHPITHWNICNPQTRQLSRMRKTDLREARSNLNRYFAVTGIVERFKESVFLMKKSFSWGRVHFKNYNVTPSRPAADSYPSEVISRIQ
ncbi:sulfotransferase family protein [Paenibacillus senegalensis]|uniref:sulfotransferase family 2 domain-containing protein n=1 Tax=Paenibacillus senegalensis TaxID=1465766 RepID=UPI000288ACED|nr:sulfotransferase family 2 domain-containing protein [Paenibacillus senegalensis]